MAKHFIKGDDGHLMELSDEEYKQHKKKGCFGTVIGAIALIIGLAIFGGKDDDNSNNNTKQSQSSIEKTISDDAYSNKKQKEETSTVEVYSDESRYIIQESVESETDESNIETENEDERVATFDE